ncbi:MAG: transcription termination/antitermination protein NusA [Anaerolineae bacterium]|nr:transcription termination/antitermination protein NusA [Anaerolineae bacterium]
MNRQMKSEFLLAFNQVCAERSLPREVVLEAIRTALVSAYRRNVGAPITQNVTAQIDLETGKASIFAEREVVEKVTDAQQEILLEKALCTKSDAAVGDLLMIESTPRNFGRIAAQTARQVILQRIREAEREAQYAHYAEQEGELVHGTVQSVSPHQITLHLERTEAVLPRKEMVPGERHVLHDRIRAYVIEVKRSGRGPQIIVSRSHKKMLQRLLELEVPEISNGTVEIKAIAREAGSRSKVAVHARQEGVDPVGACVGMRGMRIQSIVKEVGGEKVDIIEWSPDPITFIAKALGPARVLSVVLEDDPLEGKTANVVVPDDQLSLAIGKAGQNARLAAKLTNWRIDIQGATEAAEWALKKVNEDPEILPALGPVAERLPTVAAALHRHKHENMPYNDEELVAMRRIIEGIRHYYITLKDAQFARLIAEETARRTALEEARMARETQIRQARAQIPAAAFETAVAEIGLSARVQGHLKRNHVDNVGRLLELLAEGDEGLLKLDGVGAKSLAEIRNALDRLDLSAAEEAAEAAPTAEVEALAEELELEPAPQVVSLEEIAEAVETAPEIVEAVPEAIAAQEEPLLEAALEEKAAEPAEEKEPAPEVVEEEKAVKAQAEVEEAEKEPEPSLVWEEEDELDDLMQQEKSKQQKRIGRKLVYDEDRDQVILIRQHRRKEEEEDWEEYL